MNGRLCAGCVAAVRVGCDYWGWNLPTVRISPNSGMTKPLCEHMKERGQCPQEQQAEAASVQAEAAREYAAALDNLADAIRANPQADPRSHEYLSITWSARRWARATMARVGEPLPQVANTELPAI